MRTFLITILLCFINLSFAGIKVTGIIEKEGYPIMAGNGVAWISGDHTFPHKDYDIESILISKLDYDSSVDYKNRKINIKDYQAFASGKLTLVTYDKKTQKFIFNLTLQTNSLFRDFLKYKKTAFSNVSKVQFSNSKSSYIKIDGKATSLGGKVNLTTTFNPDNKSILLSYIDFCNLEIKLLEDIPVSFEVNL